MLDHKLIYQQGADQYQQLVSREDYLGNLLPALERICSADGLDIADLGAGTGRLACLLGPSARSVFAFDCSSSMLDIAASRLRDLGLAHWLTAVADHRRIPLASASVDLVISGWSFCYLVLWEPSNWIASLEAGLQEMGRILREKGFLIILETLGTGVEQPQELDKLGEYFRFLEEAGFTRDWVRTDYRFQDQEEADQLVEYFFGWEMLPKIKPGTHPILPECTGIWWKPRLTDPF